MFFGMICNIMSYCVLLCYAIIYNVVFCYNMWWHIMLSCGKIYFELSDHVEVRDKIQSVVSITMHVVILFLDMTRHTMSLNI